MTVNTKSVNTQVVNDIYGSSGTLIDTFAGGNLITFRQQVFSFKASGNFITFRQEVILRSAVSQANFITFRQIVKHNKPQSNLITFRQRVYDN